MWLDHGRARGRELERLEVLLSRAADDGPALCALDGEGVPELLAAFAERARTRQAIVLAGTARPGEPFSALEAPMDAALGIVPNGRDAFPDLACSAGCCVPWFRHPAEPPDVEAAAELRRARIDATARLFERVAALGPTALVLSGPCPSELADVIARLMAPPPSGSAARPLLVVVAPSGGCDASWLDAACAHPRARRVTLAPLDADSLRELLASPELIARVLARTGGDPGAIERLLDATPLSPDEHLARRMAGLSPDAQASCDALAVLARPATPVEVAHVAGVEASPGTLSELAEAGLATRDATSGCVALAEAADGARLASALPPGRRADLHARAAETSDASGAIVEAARHAVAAGLADRAESLVARAAAKLCATSAHREAAAVLAEIGSALSPEAVARLEGALAEALIGAGELRAAVGPASRAARRAPGDPAAAERYARALVLAGDLDRAARWLEQVRDRFAPSDLARLDAMRAELHYQRGRLDEAEAVAERTGGALDALQTRAKVALARGDFELAAARYGEYELAARAASDGVHEALAAGGLGVALLTAGRLSEAETALERCRAVGARARSRKALALASHNLAVAAHLQHDYVRARERYEEALSHLAVVGNRASLARVAWNLGELYETFGDLGRARAMCEYGASVAGPDVPPRALGEGLLLRARVALADGQTDAARVAFESARDVLSPVDPLRAAAALVGIARVEVREGRLGSADAAIRELPDGLPPNREADLALVRAELAVARGDAAIAAAEAAVSLAEASSDDRSTLEALVLLARVLRDEGDVREAARVHARASELDRSLGMRVPADLAPAWAARPVRLALDEAGRSREVTAQLARPGSRGPAARLGIVGDSPGIRRVLSLVDRIGRSACSVLVRGESGTGKELVARALHATSPRARGPLVAVSCATLVDSLLLSELFGHERGAFTGAIERKPGRFELAHGGTLFLDEIGDVSPAVQAALLRVLQERSFERVGGTRSLAVDVRIVAATNRDLEALVAKGEFREDLYYRLVEVSIELPPLRDRTHDVPLLVEHFLAGIAEERGEAPKRLTPRAVRALVTHPWPGNVRQLENLLRAATLFADGDELDEPALSLSAARTGDLREPTGARPGDEVELCYARLRGGEVSLRDLKKEIERDLIERALADSDGNISRAATVLGMKRPRLSQLVKEYGLRTSGEDG